MPSTTSSPHPLAPAMLLLPLLLLLSLHTPGVAATVQCPALPARHSLNSSTQSTLTTPDGLVRSYYLFIPPGYTPSTTSPSGFPLVLFLHGGLGTALNAQVRYGWTSVAQSSSLLVVYPQATGVPLVNTSWNAGGGCCGPAARLGIDDVLFLTLLTQRLQTQFCLDSAAVFATGMSNGAILAQRLGCDPAFSLYLAAIAPVEGTMPLAPQQCNSSTPIAVLEVHGTNDSNVPYEGGYGCGVSLSSFSSVPFSLSTWIALQSCARPYPASLNSTAPNSTELDGWMYDFGPCQRGPGGQGTGDVRLVMIQEGGHSWSGSAESAEVLPGCSGTVGRWPATQRIWQFFDGHRKAVTTGGPSSSSGGGSSGGTQYGGSSSWISSSSGRNDGSRRVSKGLLTTPAMLWPLMAAVVVML